ncbi:DUF1127 domain-containing protein [Bradyrhizobium sp. BRP22]|uniref:DUF1127 domain-containing protein n=1 Tax=Bradyrhizobium sp. BRP22 TaxID=2793821 RepID=UPI001CD25F9C|nr:DUF1127 domain-containing protein [Bradyrhizobium sp. BRP22]MCA1454443.1 DUF1127 domain-containing protein [Bradyrhizobium sp. BRP22]
MSSDIDAMSPYFFDDARFGILEASPRSRVTAVAVFSSAGMLRKYGSTRISRLIFCREISMSHVEQLFYSRPYLIDRRQAPNGPRWYVSISAMVMFLLSKMREELAIRRAISELRDLDDRMLRDIGLSRYDIGSIRRRETCLA